MYNYKEIVKRDIKDWMDDNQNLLEGLDREEMYEVVYDSCWNSDSVTGNASGSYTFNRNEARKNFFEDDDSDEYIEEMIDEGFTTSEEVGKIVSESNWERLDVYIRLWLLCDCLSETLDEMYDD